MVWVLSSSVGDGCFEDVCSVVSILAVLGFAVILILMTSASTIAGWVVGLTSEQYTSSKGHKNTCTSIVFPETLSVQITFILQ